jgi:hypothetical protein
MAQPAPPAAEPQLRRVFCEQTITYRLADPSSVPEPYRRFRPLSDAAWDANICAALVVTEVQPDGTAAIIYVGGPRPTRGAGGVLHGTGVIRDRRSGFRTPTALNLLFDRRSPISSGR